MRTEWILKQNTPDEGDYKSIAALLQISPVTVRCMCNRGITSVPEMRKYLSASLSDLYDPFLMKGMSEAVELLISYRNSGVVSPNEAVDDASADVRASEGYPGECGRHPVVAIASDYDCDGICSAMILKLGLERVGFDTEIFTPDRVAEGYGMNRRIVDDAGASLAGLIITCDNGIAAVDAVTYAKEKGMCVIVTDHHEPQEVLPPADVIVDPKQDGETYPFNGLCGAGVAYKLIGALFEKLSHGCGDGEGTVETVRDDISYEPVDLPPHAECEYLEYAAIATVADVMELVDENRILVSQGLLQLENTKHIGLGALLGALSLEDKKIKASDIGFRIGPTLNASGRISSVAEAFELLQSDNKDRADERAGKLALLNTERQRMTDTATEQALDMIRERFPDIDDGICDDILVIYVPGVHESIIGLVAGKIKERFNHPAIAFTDTASGDDGEEMIKGSGRSIRGYHMFNGLMKCKDLTVAFGGHEMAAGLTIPKAKLGELIKRLNDDSELAEEDFILKLNIDVATPISYVNEELITELERMAPFGVANPRPLFAEKDLEVKYIKYLGNEGQHLKLTLTNGKGCVRDAMCFSGSGRFDEYIEKNYGEKELGDIRRGKSDIRLALAYRPEINVWNDRRSIQLMVEDFR